MASTRTLRAMMTVFLVGGMTLAALHRAQADDDTPRSSTRFPRFRVAGSLEAANADLISFAGAGSSVSVSYDFCRLSHLPGGSGDPSALSVYVESAGDNPLHQSYGSSLFGGIMVRTPARPVYLRFGIGLSHDDLYENNFVYADEQNALHRDYTLQFFSRRRYAPAVEVGFRLFLGLDVPKTPLFAEAGLGFDSGAGTDFGSAGGLSLQFGVRL